MTTESMAPGWCVETCLGTRYVGGEMFETAAVLHFLCVLCIPTLSSGDIFRDNGQYTCKLVERTPRTWERESFIIYTFRCN
jgi:hypothetical protein